MRHLSLDLDLCAYAAYVEKSEQLTCNMQIPELKSTSQTLAISDKKGCDSGLITFS